MSVPKICNALEVIWVLPWRTGSKPQYHKQRGKWVLVIHSDWSLCQRRQTVWKKKCVFKWEIANVKLSPSFDYRKLSLTCNKGKGRYICNVRTCKWLFLYGFRLELYIYFLFIIYSRRDPHHFMNHVSLGIWLSLPFGNLSYLLLVSLSTQYFICPLPTNP